MKSNYKRDISKDYFLPLSIFKYNPRYAMKGQIDLANKIAENYKIPEGNALRLIMYVDKATCIAYEIDTTVYYSDIQEILRFEENTESLKEIVFKGKNQSLAISNPYILDALYSKLLEFTSNAQAEKELNFPTGKKTPSNKLIKQIATEVYNELINSEKLGKSQGLYILGFIYAYYGIGLKKEEPILDEHAFNHKSLIGWDSYLQYLGERMKRFIIQE